jgi:hypothetical protein
MDYPAISFPGFYWYFAKDKEPQIVWLRAVNDYSALRVVFFGGQQDPRRLEDLPGEFVGPVIPPLTEAPMHRVVARALRPV